MAAPTESIDPLTELQLQVARRADQIAASRSDRTLLNLPCWLRAEEEILEAFRNPGVPNVAQPGLGRGGNPRRPADERR
jgi:hypothetical protein